MAPSGTKTVATAKTWKKQTGTDLELPSGNVCRVKRPGMEKLLGLGILPDSLTPLAMEAVQRAETGRPQDHKKPGDEEIDPKLMQKFLEEEGAVEAIFSSFDRVTALCVVEPKVLWHLRDTGEKNDKGKPVYEEIPEDERDEDILYTDEVDLDDKTFIFQFVVGGTSDLEEFRKEQPDDVATVQPRKNVAVPTKRAPRAKK